MVLKNFMLSFNKYNFMCLFVFLIVIGLIDVLNNVFMNIDGKV